MWTDLRLGHPRPLPPWQERDFTRKLNPDRYRRLFTRAVTSPQDSLSTIVEPQPETDPEQVLPISLPVMVEGRIGRPGDADHFSFQAQEGLRLAFEIAPPDRPPPEFSPWIELLDADGQPVCSNIYRMVEANSAYWLKFLKPKTIFVIAEEGDYVLRVRDLTSQRGGPDFTYRLLVRPQLPHVGDVTVKGSDPINLAPGEVKKLSVTIDQEEGFDGLIAVSVENLPAGVRALPTIPETKPPAPATGPRGEVHREWFFPETRTLNLSLLADPQVPPSKGPVPVKLTVRAVAGRRLAEPFPVQQLYLTVISTDPPPALIGQLALEE